METVRLHFKFSCLLRSTESEHPREKSGACVSIMNSIPDLHSRLDVANRSALLYLWEFYNAHQCLCLLCRGELIVERQYVWSRNPYWSALWVYKSLFLGYESKCALSLLWICGLLFSHLQAFGQRQRICKFLFPVLFRALLSSSTLTRSSVYCEKLWIYIVWLSNSLLPSRADVQAVLGFLWKFHSRFPSSVISGCPLLSQ